MLAQFSICEGRSNEGFSDFGSFCVESSDADMLPPRKRRRKDGNPDIALLSTNIRDNLRDKKDSRMVGFQKLGHRGNNNRGFAKASGGKVIAILMKIKDDQKPVKPACVKRLGKNLRRKRVLPRSSICNSRVVLSRLLENNEVLPGTKVYYRGSKGRSALAEGWITCDGIKCGCCNVVFTLTGFEAHAGSKNHRPAANIFLEDGRSLMDCQRKMVSRKPKGKPNNVVKCSSHQVENYVMCCICHDRGEFICCVHCSSTFHMRCLGLKDIPGRDWVCPLCCCGVCCKSTFERRSKDSVEDDIVHTCDQCEHKFHMGCTKREKREIKLKSQGKWFCSDSCEHVFSNLHELLGKTFDLSVPNLTWRLLKNLESDQQGAKIANDCEVLKDMQRKLNVAVDVMHECFESAKDPSTGRDLVEEVIFSRRSELNSPNYGGFYTVVIEKKGKIASVAIVKVYEKVAEVPFVATRFKYRRHGMCRLLMGELEKQLIALGVDRLILPAAPSVLDTWTSKFGFSKMTDSERLKYLSYTFLDFQDTIMCQKLLTKTPSANLSPSQ